MTTTLPAPSAEHLTPRGTWPHTGALRTELRALVADLDPQWIDPASLPPRRPDEPPVAPFADRRRLMVVIHAPGGVDEVSLGWLPIGRVDEAVARIVDHLPGSRVEQERPVESERYAAAVLWGGRSPGWTPTALAVVGRLSGPVWRERRDVWTVDEVAEHLGIAASTWRSYVARRDAGAPPSLGRIYELRGPREYPVEVWDAATVREWHESRPGKGGVRAG